VEPLITDTAGEFQFCTFWGVFVGWGFGKWLILRLCPSYYPIRLKGHPWLTFLTSQPIELLSGSCTRHYRCRKLVWITDLCQQLLLLWPSLVVTVNGNSTRQEYVICRTVHINISEKWNVVVRIMSCVGAVLECQMGCVYRRLSPSFFQLAANGKIFQKSLNTT
jgi:hypothetical protein